jgi:Domain of unknown function (DUF4397)
MMLKRIVSGCIAALLALSMIGAVEAAHPPRSSNATISVIHGIDGRDLGAAQSLPVDVSVNGACALKNFTFGTITGPITLPAGNYNFAVSLADGKTGCTNAPVITRNGFRLKGGDNVSFIAQLSPRGPRLSSYYNNITRASRMQSRLVIRHSANAPAVDVNGRGVNTTRDHFGIRNVVNGIERTRNVMGGTYAVTITPSGGKTPVLGPANVSIKPSTLTAVYAVGTPANGTFTVLVQEFALR